MADPTPEAPKTDAVASDAAAQVAPPSQAAPEPVVGTEVAEDAPEAAGASPVGDSPEAGDEAETDPAPQQSQKQRVPAVGSGQAQSSDAPVGEPLAEMPAEDPETVAARSALEAPGHAVGDTIIVKRQHHLSGCIFPVGVDGHGRIWSIQDDERGIVLTLAGRLQT